MFRLVAHICPLLNKEYLNCNKAQSEINCCVRVRRAFCVIRKFSMDLKPTISRFSIHEYIFNHGLQSSIQDKKILAFQFVINIFEFDENNIEVHEAIIDIKKCLDQSFFNR